MSNLHYFVSGPIADEMVEGWGASLQRLNVSEKLWLVRNGLTRFIDWELENRKGMDRNVAAAEDALIGAPDDFKLKVIYGFCKYLIHDTQPLSYYLSDRNYSGWIEIAFEYWGSRLERLPENSGLIFIFNLATDLIDFESLPNLDRLHQCLEAFNASADDENIFTIISALADLANDQALAESR